MHLLQAPLRDSRPPFKRLPAIALGTLSFLLLFFSILVLNAIQTLSLVTLPFSRKLFRSLNRWFAGLWWSFTVILSERVHGFQVVFTGDSVPADENAIIIGNHQEMPDILMVMFLAFTRGRIADLKWFAKDIIKYVPGVGWGMLFLDCIFLKRTWLKDRDPVLRTFEKFHRERIPFWLVSFPEGTRIKPAKFERATTWAISKGLKPSRYLLPPRVRGFAAATAGLSRDTAAIYDLTIGYEQGVPTLGQLFSGAARRAHVHVRRFPLVALPTDETAIGEWLRARFYEKDQLLAHFFERGSFPVSR